MDIQRLGGGITVHSGWALIAPWRNQRTKLERWWWDFKFDHLASSVSLKFFFHMICYRKLSSIFDKQFHILLFKFGICNLLSLGLSPGLGHFQASLLLLASWRFLWDPPKTHPEESWTEESRTCGISMWNFPRDFIMAFQIFFEVGMLHTTVHLTTRVGSERPSIRSTLRVKMGEIDRPGAPQAAMLPVYTTMWRWVARPFVEWVCNWKQKIAI